MSTNILCYALVIGAAIVQVQNSNDNRVKIFYGEDLENKIQDVENRVQQELDYMEKQYADRDGNWKSNLEEIQLDTYRGVWLSRTALQIMETNLSQLGEASISNCSIHLQNLSETLNSIVSNTSSCFQFCRAPIDAYFKNFSERYWQLRNNLVNISREIEACRPNTRTFLDLIDAMHCNQKPEREIERLHNRFIEFMNRDEYDSLVATYIPDCAKCKNVLNELEVAKKVTAKELDDCLRKFVNPTLKPDKLEER